jgi:hypothetical protein
MSVNEHMTNERRDEWEDYFNKLQNQEYLEAIEKGDIIRRSLCDWDIVNDKQRSNASEEIIVEHNGYQYHLGLQEDDGQITIICEQKIALGRQI